jgi:NADH-quinone oxidoreductase subunit H
LSPLVARAARATPISICRRGRRRGRLEVTGAEILIALFKIVCALGILLGLAGPLTWAERRQSAMIQDRVGPNRANIGRFRFWGLLHPFADFIKMLTKEDVRPEGANRLMHTLAPLVAMAPVFLVFAVVPFGGPVCFEGDFVMQGGAAMCRTGTGLVPAEKLQVADLNVGLLFVFAIGSLAVYGPTIAGWASNSKYALLGSLRTAAQMLSYEVVLGLTVMGCVMVYGTVETSKIVEAQAGPFWKWGVFLQPLGFVLFLVAAIAETKRAPFDLPEAESELVAGYFLEYSGTKFAAFYTAEFVAVLVVSGVAAMLFFGGWQVPWLHADGFHIGGEVLAVPRWLVVLLQVGKFIVTLVFLAWLQLLIRWTFPRFRYDQLMRLGWKVLLPLALANILVTGIVILALEGRKGA